jgi:hypothetical protein
MTLVQDALKDEAVLLDMICIIAGRQDHVLSSAYPRYFTVVEYWGRG